MLRIKKYNQINKNSMIQFLKKFKYDETDIFDTKIYDLKIFHLLFYLYLKKYINTNIIKKYNIYNIPFLNASNNITYQIVKDSFTETWFFTCNKLVILYISKNAIDDFYNTWMFSRIYKFVIYQDLEYYIVFCISHTSDQIRNYLDFLVNNNHNPKYLIFSCFLLNNNKTNSSHDLEFVKYNEKMILNESAPVGFVVLNNNYKGINPKRMQFYKTLGYGKTNHTLFHLVKISFKLIQESRNLPVNYFV
jgi:hypothetical protein